MEVGGRSCLVAQQTAASLAHDEARCVCIRGHSLIMLQAGPTPSALAASGCAGSRPRHRDEGALPGPGHYNEDRASAKLSPYLQRSISVPKAERFATGGGYEVRPEPGGHAWSIAVTSHVVMQQLGLRQLGRQTQMCARSAASCPPAGTYFRSPLIKRPGGYSLESTRRSAPALTMGEQFCCCQAADSLSCETHQAAAGRCCWQPYHAESSSSTCLAADLSARCRRSRQAAAALQHAQPRAGRVQLPGHGRAARQLPLLHLQGRQGQGGRRRQGPSAAPVQMPAWLFDTCIPHLAAAHWLCTCLAVHPSH